MSVTIHIYKACTESVRTGVRWDAINQCLSDCGGCPFVRWSSILNEPLLTLVSENIVELPYWEVLYEESEAHYASVLMDRLQSEHILARIMDRAAR